MIMKYKKSDEAVSEIVGIVLMLGITISLFAVLCNVVLSFPSSPASPSANLVGTIEVSFIVIEHRGGEELSLDTEIVIEIDGVGRTLTARDLLDDEAKNDNLWGIGEWLVYRDKGVIEKKVSIIVIDVKSNSVIMSGIFKGTR